MKRLAKELAAAIGAKVEGDGALELAGVAGPERAGTKDLIYVEAVKHVERAVASVARCVIAAEGVVLPGKTVLRSAQPKVAFAKAAAILLERAPVASGIHPTAIVAPLAQLDADVSVGAYAVIGEDTRIGAGTQIGAHSFGHSLWSSCGTLDLSMKHLPAKRRVCSRHRYAPRKLFARCSGNLGGSVRRKLV